MVEKMTKYIPASYESKALAHNSSITVKTKFNESKLTALQIIPEEVNAIFNQQAVEKMQEEAIDRQSPELDAITGATESSSAVKRALKDCFAKASGKEMRHAKTVKDGTYQASAPSYGFMYPMTGEVTFQDNKITDINITKESDSLTSQWFEVAKEKMIPRIIKNQSLDTDVVTGASASSAAIRSITEKAIAKAGGEVNDWHTPVSTKTDTVILKDYDVIVVGLGGSGVLSYCAAAKSGAKVFGIEAAGAIGGNSVSTFGPMVVNSKELNAKYNNGQDNIDPADLYKTWIKYVGSDSKAEVIKTAIDQCGPAIDYYIKNFGFSFDGVFPGAPVGGFLPSFVREDWSKEWIIYTADRDNKKWYVSGPDHAFQFKTALEKAKGMNPNNNFKLELRAKKLLTDDTGGIIGVEAQYYDGTIYRVFAKSVILASGGFIGNSQMMKEVYGADCHVFGSTTAKGDGIRMARELGADTYALKTLPMIHISQVPYIIRDNSLSADQKAILSALATTPEAKQIDETGKILGSEDDTGTTNSDLKIQTAFAPGFHYFNAYSQNEIDWIRENGLAETTAKINIFAIGQGGKMPAPDTPIKDIDQIIDQAIIHRDVWKGTVRELAELLNMDQAKLAEALGSKTEIFYLFENAAYAYATCGGLNINEKMNVLRKDSSVIDNLFAVGQDSEGVENKNGEAYTPWGGQAQAWTFVSGKIAGENAASL